MRNFVDSFCKTTGVIVGFMATITVLGWAFNVGEEKAEAKSEE